MKIEEIYKLFLKYPVISTDSRKPEKNSLFFALKGESFDGNMFTKNALENGCAYAIVDNPIFALNSNCILVNDTLETLTELAKYHRKKLRIPILAITGTNGKTTTKELISHVLLNKFNLVYTKGNLNNHIGVPLTLLSMNSETQFGVIEMGANHPMEIKHLCEIAEPDFGIITNIGKAHLEGFGSFENIIKTKKELYDFLENSNGTIFYNTENKILSQINSDVNISKIAFGNGINSDVCGSIISSNPFLFVKIQIASSELNINSKLIGNYNFENILAAVSIGYYFDVDPLKIKEAIENYTPSNNRSQLIKSNLNTIYLDAYNANPSSIEASLINFIQLNVENKCVILGDMLELGNDAVEEHKKVIDLINKAEFSKVILVGNIYANLNETENFIRFKDVNNLKIWLENNRIVDSHILVKGSRGIQLERIVEYL
ncbi:MAG: hypothetical protein A2041_07750 [Bacteroidetes bacterium GWA2_31_9b]|nr:MAG: hypothetical protein A2041_07750 [Bacteroidetes bacterium GWA2_31_9b]